MRNKESQSLLVHGRPVVNSASARLDTSFPSALAFQAADGSPGPGRSVSLGCAKLRHSTVPPPSARSRRSRWLAGGVQSMRCCSAPGHERQLPAARPP